MYKLILLLFAILILPFATQAQIIDGLPVDSTITTFTNDSVANYIPDTAAAPLWQIGRTHKSFFTTDSSGTIAIMTDTLNPYRVNANNWFVIKVPNTFNAIVDFWHKYQTDTGHDGGIVEFSLDTGITWQNIKGACNADSVCCWNPGVYTTNFYSAHDTLATGEPSFNGTSDSLQYSRFQFFTGFPIRSTSGGGCTFWGTSSIYVRFRFVSDSVADSLAGWEIDSIKIEHDLYPGLVRNINKPKTLSTYPNPSYDGQFSFPAIENEQNYTIEVYDAMGQKIYTYPYSHSLDLSNYARGLYFYQVSDGTEYYSGRLLTQ